jgi:hypothetical protein
MGGSTQSDTKTTTQNLTPEQQALVGAAVPNYMNFAGSNPTLPGAAGVAPFTPAQIQGQKQVLGSTGQMGDVVGSAADTNRYLSSGTFLDPGSNPYVQNAVKAATDPIYRNLTTSVLPQIQGSASTGAGGISANFGGSRQGIAEGLATEGAERAAGQAGAGILNTALGQGLQATGQAVAQAPTTAGSLAIPGATTSSVGDVQQQQQQNVLNAANQASWFQQMLPLLKAQMLTQGAAGLPGGSTTSTGSGSSDPGILADILGGGAVAGGLMGGLGNLMKGTGATSLSSLLPMLLA